MNLEMTVCAQCLKIFVIVVMVVAVAVVNSEMVNVLVATLFAAQLLISPDRDDETTQPVIAFPRQVLIQDGAPARAEREMPSLNALPTHRTRQLFGAKPRAEILFIPPRGFYDEELPASLTWNLLARFLSTSKETLPICNAGFHGTGIGAEARRSICPEPPREGLAAALTAIDLFAILFPLKLKKAFLGTKARGNASISRTLKSARAMLTPAACDCHLPPVYNVWPGR